MGTEKIEKVFKGTVVHSLSLNQLEIIPSALIGVTTKGVISFLHKSSSQGALDELKQKHNFEDSCVVDLGNKLLMPGFIDTHTHAPQYQTTGTGTGLPLMEWLNTYAFPSEVRCSDIKFAKEVYTRAVQRVMMNGTTMCVYYATIHLQATEVLMDIVHKYGQRAFIGKVCMDINSPQNYVESTEDSILNTEIFIKKVKSLNSPLITPIITPRYVLSCSSLLMKKLGELAGQYDVPIQSHISENLKEVSLVAEQHPDKDSYSQVYDHYGLLTSKTIMAHGVYLSDGELALFQKRGVSLSHCPLSNFTLCSGTLCVRKVLEAGIKVGLGTDVSGGYSPSMLDAIRQTMVAATAIHFQVPKYKPLTWQEAFHLATVGGSEVVGMSHVLGNLLPGKHFDALVIDPMVANSPFDVFPQDSIENIFQKFLLLGDDRNISEVYIMGRLVVPFKNM